MRLGDVERAGENLRIVKTGNDVGKHVVVRFFRHPRIEKFPGTGTDVPAFIDLPVDTAVFAVDPELGIVIFFRGVGEEREERGTLFRGNPDGAGVKRLNFSADRAALRFRPDARRF